MVEYPTDSFRIRPQEVFALKNFKIYVLLLVIFLLNGCMQISSLVQGEINEEEQLFISERIKLFSEKHFTLLEKCEVNFTENGAKVYIEFIPDFGSIIFKNDIWRIAAAHAMNLVYIFPEINEYRYVVFDKNKDKLMDLFLDEVGIRSLPEKFYGVRGPGNYYRYCFTKVEITPKGNELPLDENFFEGSQLP